MKLLQLNAWGFRLDEPIKQLLREEQPDIICFQEATSSNRSTGKIVSTIEGITAEQDYKTTYYSPLVEFPYMHGTLRRGNAIYSTLPTNSETTFFTHGATINDFDYEECGSYNKSRGVAHVEFTVNDTPLHILTTHGYHLKGHKRGNRETLQACQQIADYISKLSGAVILTGDFNLEPTSPSLEPLHALLRNHSIEANLPTTRNQLTPKTEVCDYIFTNEKVQVHTFMPSEQIVSDHAALLLEFLV